MPKKSITPGQIRTNNRQLIYRYIYHNKKTSQLDIAYALRLSRPTVATNLAELESEGLICKDGVIDSDQIGRKAAAYSIVSSFRVGIGVEITQNQIKMMAVDLYGSTIKGQIMDLSYENTDAYYDDLSGKILAFISSLDLSDEKTQIAGVGFAMQGLVAPDGRSITYGKILECTGLKIDVFQSRIPCPCRFIHDADSAALTELWFRPEIHDAFFLSLSQHLGAALIHDRRILTGKHGHTATAEHMQMAQLGKKCYCGQIGCAETLCSMDALLGEEDAPAFFRQVRSGEKEAVDRWKTYLDYLARFVQILHLIYDVDFIIGGYLPHYIEPEDIQYLYEKIKEKNFFEEDMDFLTLSVRPEHGITVGAALPFIQDFLAECGV